MRRGETALVAVVLWAAVALTACAGSKPAQRAAAAQASHPEVDTGLETCAGCHAQATPAVTAQWSGSRHGMALVECFVCHGSTGEDFRARPETSGCGGCHAAQVTSIAGGGKATSCFQCHPAHALRAQGKTSPHPPRPLEGT